MEQLRTLVLPLIGIMTCFMNLGGSAPPPARCDGGCMPMTTKNSATMTARMPRLCSCTLQLNKEVWLKHFAQQHLIQAQEGGEAVRGVKGAVAGHLEQPQALAVLAGTVGLWVVMSTIANDVFLNYSVLLFMTY